MQRSRRHSLTLISRRTERANFLRRAQSPARTDVWRWRSLWQLIGEDGLHARSHARRAFMVPGFHHETNFESSNAPLVFASLKQRAIICFILLKSVECSLLTFIHSFVHSFILNQIP